MRYGRDHPIICDIKIYCTLHVILRHVRDTERTNYLKCCIIRNNIIQDSHLYSQNLLLSLHGGVQISSPFFPNNQVIEFWLSVMARLREIPTENTTSFGLM